MTEAVIKYFKGKKKDSLPPDGSQSTSYFESLDINGHKSGLDVVSNLKSIVNNFDSKSTGEIVNDRHDDSRENLDNDCEIIKELTSETNLVEHQNYTKVSSKNVLEASDVRSEKECFPQNSRNDVLKHYSSSSVEKAKNGGDEIFTMKSCEPEKQGFGKTKLLKSSQKTSGTYFHREASVKGANLDSRPSIDGKNYSLSKLEAGATSEKPHIADLESHHSINLISRDIKIKPVGDNNEHGIFAESELTKPSIPSKAAVCLNTSDEFESEKSKIQLPDICIHEEKEQRPAENPSQEYVEMNKNGSNLMTESDVSECDQIKSAISEAEDDDVVSQSNKKILFDTDEADAAPTRVRTRIAIGSRHLTNLPIDEKPEIDVKNGRSAQRSSALIGNVSNLPEELLSSRNHDAVKVWVRLLS